jgi:hypothetical protein
MIRLASDGSTAENGPLYPPLPIEAIVSLFEFLNSINVGVAP